MFLNEVAHRLKDVRALVGDDVDVLVSHIVAKTNKDLVIFALNFTGNTCRQPTAILEVILFADLLPVLLADDKDYRDWKRNELKLPGQDTSPDR